MFVLFRWTVGLESTLTQVAAIILCGALATLSYRLIEQPFRRISVPTRWPNLVTLIAGIVIVTGAWSLYQTTAKLQPRLTLNTVSQHSADWYPMQRETSSDAPGCMAQGIANQVAGNLLLTYTRVGCDRPVDWNFTLFVVGDSHTMAYVPMLTQLVMDKGVKVRLYNNGGCPFLSFQAVRESEACQQNSQGSLKDIIEHAQAGDVLFMPSLRLSRFADQFVHFPRSKTMNEMFDEKAVAGRTKLEAQAKEWLVPLADNGVKLVFEAPKLIFEIPPFRCANWFDRHNPACAYGRSVARDSLERYRQPVVEIMDRLVTSHSGISVWDPFPVLCPGAECHVEQDGRPLFYDADHVSGYGNMVLTPNFKRFITSLRPL